MGIRDLAFASPEHSMQFLDISCMLHEQITQSFREADVGSVSNQYQRKLPGSWHHTKRLENMDLIESSEGAMMHNSKNDQNYPNLAYRSTADLAKVLGITQEAITKALRAKRIRGIKAGKKWLIPVDEYERILREGYS